MELCRVTILFDHRAHIDRYGLYRTTNNPTTARLIPWQRRFLEYGNLYTCSCQSPGRDRTGWTAADHNDVIRETHLSRTSLCKMKYIFSIHEGNTYQDEPGACCERGCCSEETADGRLHLLHAFAIAEAYPIGSPQEKTSCHHAAKHSPLAVSMTTCMWYHAEESSPTLAVICGSLWSKTAWPYLVCPWELQE